MATIQNVVRWADNTDQLAKNLSQGLDQIEAITKSADKMAKAMSGDKLIQSAHNMVAAIEKIGGAEKLTAAEKEKINALLTKAIEKYEALGKTAPTAMKDLAKATEAVEKPTKSWSQMLDGVITGAVAGLTVMVLDFARRALTAAIQGLGDFIKRGGEVAAMSRSFEALSGGADGASVRIGAVRDSTKGLIADFDIMKASNKAMLLGLGLNADQMGELAKTATILGRAMGQDATKSLDDLITALGRSSPMILDNLGLSVKVGEANAVYAQRLGKTADALTEAERKQAFMTAAMDAAADKVRTIGGLQLTASDRLTQLWTSTKNVTDATATWIVQLPVLNTGLTNVVNSLQLWETLLREGVGPTFQKYKEMVGETPPKVAALTNKWALQGLELKALTMSEAELNAETQKLEDQIKEQIDTQKKWNDELAKFSGASAVEKGRELVKIIGALGGPMKVLPSQMEQMATGLRAAAEGARAMGNTKLANEFDLLAKTMNPLVVFQQKYNVTIGEYVPSADAAADATAAMWDEFFRLTGQVQQIVPPLKSTLDLTKMLGVEFKAAVEAVPPPTRWSVAWSGMKEGLSNNLAEIPGTLARAFEGGGDIWGAVKSIASKIGSTLGAGIGFAVGGPMGEKIGSAIGSLAGPLMEGFKKLFGIGANAEVKKYNEEIEKVRKTLLQTHGTLADLERKAQAVGLSFRDAWGHQGKQGLEEFNKLVDEYEARQTKLQSALEKYGITWEDLGVKAREAHLSEIANGLLDDFLALTGAGANVDFVIGKMGESTNAFVASALRTGTEIPEAMKPMLERMVEMGLLTDENGVAITDLEGSGIKFSETFTSGVDRIVSKLDEVVARLGGIVGGINSIPETKIVHIGFQVDPLPDLGDFGGGMPGFASGSNGIRDFGGGTPVVLHGRERVQTEDQMRAEQRGGGGDAALRAEVAGLRADLARFIVLQPTHLATAFRDNGQLGVRRVN